MLVKSTERRCEGGSKSELADAAAFAQQWGSGRGSGGLRFQARRSFSKSAYFAGAAAEEGCLKPTETDALFLAHPKRCPELRAATTPRLPARLAQKGCNDL